MGHKSNQDFLLSVHKIPNPKYLYVYHLFHPIIPHSDYRPSLQIGLLLPSTLVPLPSVLHITDRRCVCRCTQVKRKTYSLLWPTQTLMTWPLPASGLSSCTSYCSCCIFQNFILASHHRDLHMCPEPSFQNLLPSPLYFINCKHLSGLNSRVTSSKNPALTSFPD